MPITPNALFHTDPLTLLERMEPGQVALAYLDPPYLGSYGMAGEFGSLLALGKAAVAERQLPENRETYMRFMALLLVQARRVLSEAGSLYLHTEPRAVGYIQSLLDLIFGTDQFRTHIILPRPLYPGSSRPPANHDTIVVYTKSDAFIYNPEYRPAASQTPTERYARSDERGPFTLTDLTMPGPREAMRFTWHGVTLPAGRSWRYPAHYLDALESEGRLYRTSPDALPKLKIYLAETPGQEIGSVWDDLPRRRPAQSGRSLRFAQSETPISERIVTTASNPDDLVLDLFSGTGATLIAAQRRGRRWIGCDSHDVALEAATTRLRDAFGLEPGTDYEYRQQKELEQIHTIVAPLAPPEVPDPSAWLPEPRQLYELNKPLPIEETRHYEFKEVKGPNPVRSITNEADEYAVAFLNSEGGRIFWGVRNQDRVVVGVPLDYSQRDELNRVVGDKLRNIQPQLDPTLFRITMHALYLEGRLQPDVYLVELVVPRPATTPEPFWTGGGECFVRLDGKNQKLTGPQITDYIARRLKASPKGRTKRSGRSSREGS